MAALSWCMRPGAAYLPGMKAKVARGRQLDGLIDLLSHRGRAKKGKRPSGVRTLPGRPPDANDNPRNGAAVLLRAVEQGKAFVASAVFGAGARAKRGTGVV